MSTVEHSTATEDRTDVVTDEQSAPAAAPQVEVLVEEISIDGMCGVY